MTRQRMSSVWTCLCLLAVNACGRLGMDPLREDVPDAVTDVFVGDTNDGPEAAVDASNLDSRVADALPPPDVGTPPDAMADAAGYMARGCVERAGLVLCDIHDERRNFTAAQAFCRELGLNLGAVRSLQQHNQIKQWAVGRNLAEVMLGGTDLLVEGEWRWPDGSVFWTGGQAGQASGTAFTRWGKDEPNNTGMNEDCLTIYSESALWNDVPCALDFPAIACE